MASGPFHRGVQRSGVNSQSYHADNNQPIKTRGDVDSRSKHQEIRKAVERERERNKINRFHLITPPSTRNTKPTSSPDISLSNYSMLKDERRTCVSFLIGQLCQCPSVLSKTIDYYPVF